MEARQFMVWAISVPDFLCKKIETGWLRQVIVDERLLEHGRWRVTPGDRLQVLRGVNTVEIMDINLGNYSIISVERISNMVFRMTMHDPYELFKPENEWIARYIDRIAKDCGFENLLEFASFYRSVFLDSNQMGILRFK